MAKIAQSVASGPLNRSMRARMTLGFTLALAVLFVVADISLIAYSHYLARQSAGELLKQSRQELSAELKEPATAARAPYDFAVQEGREMQARGVRLILLDKNERVVFSSENMDGGNFQNDLQNDKKDRAKNQTAKWPLAESRWQTRRLPFREYSLVLAVPRHNKARELREFALELAGLSFLILAASAGGAWVLVGRTLAPLEALSQQAISRQAQSNSSVAHAQLQSPSDDWEMIHLVATLNGLLDRLNADTRAKARFYAAASHELRTPLQSLSGFLELGLSRERSGNEYRDALQEAHAQSRDLITLVNDLLTLNQLEGSAAPTTSDEVDIADVAERALQFLDAQIVEKNLRLDFETDAIGVLHAPWSHVEMLLRNLLENAVKYAAVGAIVRVRCIQNSFEVFNECAPTPGWDDGKIFEPFFRPDASRNSQTGGNGLGLAISKAICDTNDWQLQVHQVEGGVTASVVFDIAK